METKKWLINAIYASPSSSKKNELWHSLSYLTLNITLLWILGGHFNAICSVEERDGGVAKKNWNQNMFSDFIFDTGVVDLRFKGLKFSKRWGNLHQRLDHGLDNDRWVNENPNTTITHLECIGLDHHPVLLNSVALTNQSKHRLFRFIAAWLKPEQFVEFLQCRKKREIIARLGGIDRALGIRNKMIFEKEFIESENIRETSLRLWTECCRNVQAALMEKREHNIKIGRRPSPLGWLKVNTDGGLTIKGKITTCGGVIRDHLGRWLAGFARNIGSTSVLNAELWGAYDGLSMAWILGTQQLVLERLFDNC
ncbi:hypothetical protein GOBAR_DD13845 [Gossypium barbadense]|nr:hypothetical protein GOBAR_DD13845 [Gossypium barbadense]